MPMGVMQVQKAKQVAKSPNLKDAIPGILRITRRKEKESEGS